MAGSSTTRLRKRDVTRGGVLSNMDNMLAADVREDCELADMRMEVIARGLAATPESGPGSTGKPGGRIRSVTRAQLKDTKAFMADRRPNIVPTERIDPDTGFIVERVYQDAEYDAMMAGHYCRLCGDLQEFAVPVMSNMHFVGVKNQCLNIKGRHGCWYPKTGVPANQRWVAKSWTTKLLENAALQGRAS